jgi:hypothetical protein
VARYFEERKPMQKKSTFAKVAAAALAAMFAIAITSFATLAASQFEGV